MPGIGRHVAGIQARGAHSIGSADVKLSIRRTGHPLRGDHVNQASFLPGRSGGIIEIHDGRPVVNKVAATIGILRQRCQQALLGSQLRNLDYVGHLTIDGGQTQRLGGAKLDQIPGIIHIIHVRTGRGGKVTAIKVPETDMSVLRQEGGVRQQRKEHHTDQCFERVLFFHVMYFCVGYEVKTNQPRTHLNDGANGALKLDNDSNNLLMESASIFVPMGKREESIKH